MVPERMSDLSFMKERNIHGESNVWSTAQRQKDIYRFMFQFVLNETIDDLAMANSVRWYGYVLW